MELARLRTELPFPTRPWEAAKAKFLDGLSPEERQRFTDATPENLFYDASASQKKYARGSRSWVMQQKATSLVEGIADYGKALDVYANASSLVLCPIWGSIRVVLHIAREAGKFQEKLVDMFASIGDALPRFHIYQIIFRNHERLLGAISDAYLDVIQFCVKAKEFFSSARGRLIPFSIVCRGMWKPFQQDFDSYILEFSKHQKRVDKEARVAHMFESARRREVESARQREVELANRALQLRNEKVNRRDRFLTMLRSVDYQAKHRTVSGLRHLGTNVWLQSDTAYVSWLSSQGSDCLCCFGIPGSGKSVLASSAIDTLQLTTDSTSILCYYYFDYADAKSLDPEYILGSLIKQVLVRLALDYFEDGCNDTMDKYSSSSLNDVRDVLASLIKNFSKVYFILDGLDELDRDGQRAVLEMIASLLHSVDPPVKIFATSRTEESSVRLFMRNHQSLEMSSAGIRNDIKLVVEQDLEWIAKHENTVLRDASIREEVSDALIRGANGMFLWVKFQMYDIREAITESTIRTTIRNLPRDLSETYARIIERVWKGSGGQAKIELMAKVVQWICCARRPLLLVELEEAVGLDETDTYLHYERMATNSGERLVSGCGNLVVYDRVEKTVALAHHTVEQFLCTWNSTQSLPRKQSIQFDQRVADHRIGKICIAYLRFTDFEQQVYQPEQSMVLGRKDAENIIWNRIPLSSFVRTMISSSKTPCHHSATTEYTFPSPKSSHKSENTYALLPYVIEFWLHHSSRMPDDNVALTAFSHVVLHHQLPFEFRPWRLDSKSDVHHVIASWFSIYVWALQNCMMSLFCVLVRDAEISQQLKQHLAQSHNITKFGFISSDEVIAGYLTIISAHKLDSWPTKISSAALYALGTGPVFILLAELEKHSPSNLPAYLDPLIIDTLRVAIEQEGHQAAVCINQVYVSSSSQLSRLFIEMVHDRTIPAPVIASLLCTQIPDNPKFEDEFHLALKTFLPLLIEVISSRPFSACELNGRYTSFFLHSAVEVGNIKWLETILDQTCPETPRNWPMGSVNVTPLAYIFRQCWALTKNGRYALATKGQENQENQENQEMYPEVLIRLVHIHPWDRFPISHFENAGIQCLKWSSRMDMVEVTQALIPHYKEYIPSSSKGSQYWVDTLGTARGPGTKSFIMLLQDISWPIGVVRGVLSDAALRYHMDDLLRETYERLADKHCLPRPEWCHLPDYATSPFDTISLTTILEAEDIRY